MFRLPYRALATCQLSKLPQQSIKPQIQQNKLRSLMNKFIQRFSTQSGEYVSEQTTDKVSLKKRPLRFFLGFLGMNALLAFAYKKKLDYENRYSKVVQNKLIEFKNEYEKDNSKYTIEEMRLMFDEFLVENVAIKLDEKLTQDMRKITKELSEKYPNEREVQVLASQVCEYEKYAMYLKKALIADRKYIDTLVIRQMQLNCERFGKQKPFYYDEFYNTCTKFSLDNKIDEAELCLQKYMQLNPPQYYRAAIQQIKNYKEQKKTTEMLKQISDLFEKEKNLNEREKQYVLSFIKQYPENEIQNQTDKRLADQLLKQ